MTHWTDNLTHPASVAVTASGLSTAPWWLPIVSQAHEVAGLLLAFLGCVLACLQIYVMWRDKVAK